MAGSINKAIIVGNVGSQPEIRATQATGEELATFSIATSEKWKDKNTGEPREKTDWHRVVVFAPGLVRVVKEYVNKGNKLYIEGKMQTREYEDQSGVKKYTTEVILSAYNSTLVLLDSKNIDNTIGSYMPSTTNTVGDQTQSNDNDAKKENNTDKLLDDEIPF